MADILGHEVTRKIDAASHTVWVSVTQQTYVLCVRACVRACVCFVVLFCGLCGQTLAITRLRNEPTMPPLTARRPVANRIQAGMGTPAPHLERVSVSSPPIRATWNNPKGLLEETHAQSRHPRPHSCWEPGLSDTLSLRTLLPRITVCLGCPEVLCARRKGSARQAPALWARQADTQDGPGK